MDDTAPGPRDELEAMLAEQMAAVNAAAMRALERAAECKETPQIEALYLRQAARLLHLTRQTEALDRRRAAAGDRAERRAREAYLREKEERQEEERLYRVGLGPKPRRRPKRPAGRGNGASGERIDLPDGLYIPDPLSG
jgi:hypothetical protein